MEFTRRFTTTDRPVDEQIEWKIVPVAVVGKESLVKEIEVPARWSQNAANIMAEKYLRKAGVPSHTVRIPESGLPDWLLPSKAAFPGEHASISYETSAKQVFHRLAGAWTYHGWVEGYFRSPVDPVQQSEEYARIFYDEVYACLVAQYAAPNSPQFFNTGLWWAYGIEGPDCGMWRVDPSHPTNLGLVAPNATLVEGSYRYPQPHACFLTPTADDLVNEGGIMDTWVREARIFKNGSGSGINASSWRSEKERLSGGGFASGVMGWLRIGDSAAGAIHSGGTTRRAAKMVMLDDDHPDLPAFIDWKVKEEYKAAAMYVGSQALRNIYLGNASAEDPMIDVPQQMIDRMAAGYEPVILGKGFEEEANRTIDGQNSNNSVRVTDAFMRASQTNANWELKARTTNEIFKTLKAQKLWDDLVRAAWACADPGLIFHDTVNAWNTCAADGEIRTTNPCAEFHHLDGSACNLASLNLVTFLQAGGRIDLEAYEHVLRLWTIVLDISVSMASFPAREFAVGAYNYRTLGLGYSNLGGLLMRLALPYDSDEGRALAAALTALMTGVAYRTSAEIADELGPFPRWEANQVPFRAVMQKHREACRHVNCVGQAGAIVVRAQAHWDYVQMTARSFRNAQATLIAPTGTISFVMDCDTTGIEPDFALVKHKQLAGGGSMRIVNQGVESALQRRGYSPSVVSSVVAFIESEGYLPMKGEDVYVEPEDVTIFACANDLSSMAHVLMVAAIQPFLSGAASKTINLPNDATVADVDHVYREAHRLGIKAIALYRDGSKLAQPLEHARPKEGVLEKDTCSVPDNPSEGAREKYGQLLHNAIAEAWKKNPPPDLSGLKRGDREHLPARRRGFTDKARLGGQTFYLRTGEYEDGRLGEVFIDLAGAGSTLDGFANALAKMISIALQFGAPLAEVVDALMGIRFEPSGFVELHDEIKQATSIPDFVGRDLAISYLDRQDLSQKVRMVTVETGEAIVALDRRAVALAEGRPTGEACSCGGLLVQTGTCKTCLDCGTSSGGCG